MPPGMCTRKSGNVGGDLSGMNVFSSFLLTMFLLYYVPFFHLVNFYLKFLSRFFTDKPILLVVDNL